MFFSVEISQNNTSALPEKKKNCENANILMKTMEVLKCKESGKATLWKNKAWHNFKIIHLGDRTMVIL